MRAVNVGVKALGAIGAGLKPTQPLAGRFVGTASNGTGKPGGSNWKELCAVGTAAGAVGVGTYFLELKNPDAPYKG